MYQLPPHTNKKKSFFIKFGVLSSALCVLIFTIFAAGGPLGIINRLGASLSSAAVGTLSLKCTPTPVQADAPPSPIPMTYFDNVIFSDPDPIITVVPEPSPAPTVTAIPDGHKPIVAITIDGKRDEKTGIKWKNKVDADLDLSKELVTAPDISFSDASNPTVLIVHTHTTESFTAEGVTSYKQGQTDDRTRDSELNMIRVGAELAQILTNAGIGVIHDTKLHDYPSYSGSYKDTLASIEAYIKKYPTIQFVFDLHRDALISNDEEKYKLIKRIDGVNAAQMMIIAGTDVNGLEHDNWQENFRLALRIQSEMEKRYEGIMRPLVLTAQRYNTHMTNGSLLFEIGTNGNTLNEALISVRLLGSVLSDIVLSFEK
ncbi:MAG: hypothetical protein E7491_08615 [Ruminococcaceae bacterium]|nr:hypothetical protein [Oscillospiraceae bacterium]